MSTCIFFGHRECYGLEAEALLQAIEELIDAGVDRFYVGHQGAFDRMVFDALMKLRGAHPHIFCTVVLAYLPAEQTERKWYEGYSIYPEGLETVPPRFAIERRNKWMIERADYCLCYVTHTWGGAYQFAKRAKKKGATVINLGRAELL